MARGSKRRRNSEDDETSTENIIEGKEDDGVDDVSVKEIESKNKKRIVKKTPTTLKDKIITIVQNSDTLMSLQKIKKLLISDYGYTDNKSFNTNVNKTLKSLVDGNDNNFGKIGSYHGGVTSRAYLDHQEKEKKESELRNHVDAGDILCPYCNKWCSSDCFIDEDSVARGGRHQCEHCAEEFWSWISDNYLYGHKVEYRYGDGREDYADINRRRR